MKKIILVFLTTLMICSGTVLTTYAASDDYNTNVDLFAPIEPTITLINLPFEEPNSNKSIPIQNSHPQNSIPFISNSLMINPLMGMDEQREKLLEQERAAEKARIKAEKIKKAQKKRNAAINKIKKSMQKVDYKIFLQKETMLFAEPFKTTSGVKIPAKTVFHVISENDQWCQVDYEETTGWICLKTDERVPIELVSVKMIKQTTNHTCGSACSSMALNTLGKDVSEKDFWNKADVKGYGTYVYRITHVLNYFLDDDVYDYFEMRNSEEDYYEKISQSLKNGHPVLLPLVFSKTSEFEFKTNGHYVLVKGIYVLDGEYYCITNDSWKGNVVTLPLKNLVKYNRAHSSYIIAG